MHIDTISRQIILRTYTYYLKHTKCTHPMHAAAPGAATAPVRTPRTPTRCRQRLARKDAALGNTGGSWTVLRHRWQLCDARQEGLRGVRSDVTRGSLNRALRRKEGGGRHSPTGVTVRSFLASPPFSPAPGWGQGRGAAGEAPITTRPIPPHTVGGGPAAMHPPRRGAPGRAAWGKGAPWRVSRAGRGGRGRLGL